jgi:hypothetical protein
MHQKEQAERLEWFLVGLTPWLFGCGAVKA